MSKNKKEEVKLSKEEIRNKLVMAKRCDREEFIAATKGILMHRDMSGKVIVGERALPCLQLAEEGELVVLTENDKPITFLMDMKEYLIEEYL